MTQMGLKSIIMGLENFTNKILLLCFTLFVFASCGRICGVYDLGKNYFVFDGDRKEDRIIIYNDDNKSPCEIVSGSNIIPPYGMWANGQAVQPYVTSVKYNSRWIIATTTYNDTISYWIIDKNIRFSPSDSKSIRNLFGPLDSLSFNKFLKIHTINISHHFKIVPSY